MSDYPTPKPGVKVAIVILTAAFPTIDVSSKAPLSLPDISIQVSRAGGGLTSLVTDTVRILVEVVATQVSDVETTCCDAIAALQNAQSTRVEYATDLFAFVRGFDNINGPTDFPDPDIPDKERWQFQGDLLLSTS